MNAEEVAYYMAHVNINGRLVHPSGLSFKDWMESLKRK